MDIGEGGLHLEAIQPNVEVPYDEVVTFVVGDPLLLDYRLEVLQDSFLFVRLQVYIVDVHVRLRHWYSKSQHVWVATGEVLALEVVLDEDAEAGGEVAGLPLLAEPVLLVALLT